MQESIVDEKENQKDENIHLQRFLRILANIMILCCLGGSGYLIYFVVKRSQDFAKMDPASLTWFQKNEAGLHWAHGVLLPNEVSDTRSDEKLGKLRLEK